MAKLLLTRLLAPLTWLMRRVGTPLCSLWSFALLRASLPGPLDRSNVILGPVAVEGSGRITLGRGARIYPGVLLETQGQGEIILGDNVVLSRGVHIVAFERVVLGRDCMVGEYASLRDADHRHSLQPMRHSGHKASAITLDDNVWVGRSAVVLKGVHIGSHSIVGANAVVTRDVPACSCAVGVPARVRALPIPA